MLAGVAELVDALDSKSSNSNVVRVRFPPPVQKKIIKEVIRKGSLFFLYFLKLKRYKFPEDYLFISFTPEYYLIISALAK